MTLLSTMRKELDNLWRKIIRTPGGEKREKLMNQYRELYRAYKKQIKFIEAVSEKPDSQTQSI